MHRNLEAPTLNNIPTRCFSFVVVVVESSSLQHALQACLVTDKTRNGLGNEPIWNNNHSDAFANCVSMRANCVISE